MVVNKGDLLFHSASQQLAVVINTNLKYVTLYWLQSHNTWGGYSYSELDRDYKNYSSRLHKIFYREALDLAIQNHPR